MMLEWLECGCVGLSRCAVHVGVSSSWRCRLGQWIAPWEQERCMCECGVAKSEASARVRSVSCGAACCVGGVSGMFVCLFGGLGDY